MLRLLRFLALLAVLPCGLSLPAGAREPALSTEARRTQFVFVVDDSGSMREDASDPDRLAVFTVRSLVAMLDDRDEATVVRLNGDPDGIPAIAPLSRNRPALRKLLSIDSDLAAYSGSHTPCRDALDAVHGELNRAFGPGVSQVVFFLADGDCNRGRVSTSRFLQGLESHQAGLFRFYYLGFAGRPATRALLELSRATGVEPVEVRADEPMSILEPFAEVLSESQGYRAWLLEPGRAQIPAHTAARRVRLLAVAPGPGADLTFDLQAATKGRAPTRIRRGESGVHQYPGQRVYRYAALEYTPGNTPVYVSVGNAGSRWKVLALPDYRLFVEAEVLHGSCETPGGAAYGVEVGAGVCVRTRLVNDAGETLEDLLAELKVESGLDYTDPSDNTRSRSSTRVGDGAEWRQSRARLEPGYHTFRPWVELTFPDSRRSVRLWGPTAGVEAAATTVSTVPANLDLGALLPGRSASGSFELQGNFPSTPGRFTVSGRTLHQECVHFELGGTEEGGTVALAPGQAYEVTARVDPYCGPFTVSEPGEVQLRMEFDPTGQGRVLPPASLGLSFTLTHQLGIPESITVDLTAGQSASRALYFEGNQQRPVAFTAFLPGPSQADRWPSRHLDLTVLDARDRVVSESDRTFGRGTVKADWTFDPTTSEPAAPLRLALSTHPCCDPGEYRSRLILLAHAGSEQPVEIPVVVRVASSGAASCWLPRLLQVGAGLLFLLFLLYAWNTWRQSRFINLRTLENRLIPLRWDDFGTTRIYDRGRDDVRRHLRRRLKWHRRALNWLKANPLVIGWPGRGFTETIQLDLAPPREVATALGVRLLPERDLSARLQSDPDFGKGCIFVTASGGVYFVGRRSERLRFGSLMLESDWDELGPGGYAEFAEYAGETDLQRMARPVPLARKTLIVPTPESDREEDRPAGWKLG